MHIMHVVSIICSFKLEDRIDSISTHRNLLYGPSQLLSILTISWFEGGFLVVAIAPTVSSPLDLNLNFLLTPTSFLEVTLVCSPLTNLKRFFILF